MVFLKFWRSFFTMCSAPVEQRETVLDHIVTISVIANFMLEQKEMEFLLSCFTEVREVRIIVFVRIFPAPLNLEQSFIMISADAAFQAGSQEKGTLLSRQRLAELARYEWVQDRDFRHGISESMRGLNIEGAFLDFTVSAIIFKGKWDLTWNTDKHELLHREHPNAELIVLEKAGHSMFADEHEIFFGELDKFVKSL